MLLKKAKRIYQNFTRTQAEISTRLAECEQSLSSLQHDLHNPLVSPEPEYLSAEYLPLNFQADAAHHCKRILVCGFYGAQNVGDELMLEALLQHLPADGPHDITVLLEHNRSIDASLYAPYHTLHFPSKSSDIATLARYFDYIIVGGGALIDGCDYSPDVDQHTTSFIILSIAKAALQFRKHVLVLGVSAGQQLDNPLLQQDLQYIINHANFFSLRDTLSLAAFQQCGLDTAKVQIIDDLALAHPALPPITPARSNTIGVVFIANSNLEDALLKRLGAIANALSGRPSAKILLIPFYNYQLADFHFYQRAVQKLSAIHPDVAFEIVNQPQTTTALHQIFTSCRAIISMRYHATLLATAWGLPVLCVDYSKYHQHYFNKTQYIAQQYYPRLPILPLDATVAEFTSATQGLLDHPDRSARQIPSHRQLAGSLKRILKKEGLAS